MRVATSLCVLLMLLSMMGHSWADSADGNQTASKLVEEGVRPEPQGLLPSTKPQNNASETEASASQKGSTEPQGLLPTMTTTANISTVVWSEWTPLDAIRVTGPPATVSPLPDVIDIFAGGEDDGLWHLRHQEGWTEEEKIFGPPPYNKDADGIAFRKYDLSVVHDKAAYYLFTWGPTCHALYKRCWEDDGEVTCNQSEDWTEIEGEIASRPVAVISTGRIYLFALNETGWIVKNRADLSPTLAEDLIWHGWSALKGPFKAPPTATSGGDSIHIFVPDEMGDTVHLNWSLATGKMTSETLRRHMEQQTTTIMNDCLSLLGVEDGHLIHIWHNGTAWQNAVDLGGDVRGRPSAVSDGTRIWVFAEGEGEKLWTIVGS